MEGHQVLGDLGFNVSGSHHSLVALPGVLDAGLVCAEESCYLLTEKGKEFLQVYEDYEKRRRAINDHINSLNSGRQKLEKLLRI